MIMNMKGFLKNMLSIVALGITILIIGCGSVENKDISSASGYSISINANPNSVPSDNGLSTISVTVTDQNGKLVTGVIVYFSTTLGVFPIEDKEYVGISTTTSNGYAYAGLRGDGKKGTAVVVAQVEDAVRSVQVTMY